MTGKMVDCFMCPIRLALWSSKMLISPDKLNNLCITDRNCYYHIISEIYSAPVTKRTWTIGALQELCTVDNRIFYMAGMNIILLVN